MSNLKITSLPNTKAIVLLIDTDCIDTDRLVLKSSSFIPFTSKEIAESYIEKELKRMGLRRLILEVNQDI